MEKKQGRGGSLALFTVLARWLLRQREGDRRDGSPPKKGKKDVTRGGPSSLDQLQINDLC